MRLNDIDISVLERALLSHAGLLRLCGDRLLAESAKKEATQVARAAGLVQRHKVDCACDQPPVLRGVPN